MFTLGIPDNQYRRATHLLGPENANPIEYNTLDQGDGFYIFSFDIDYDGFQDIVIYLKHNGVTTIGADDQLTERNIMKLTDLLKEQPESFNSMESADDIIARLEEILVEWERKEYESDQSRYENYYLDIEELVEDYKENQSMDRPDTDIQTEQKLRNLIKKIIQE